MFATIIILSQILGATFGACIIWYLHAKVENDKGVEVTVGMGTLCGKLSKFIRDDKDNIIG